MILTCAQMKAAEDALFATGVEAEALMEKAGRGCAETILQHVTSSGRARIYIGKGHNGGDALVIGRYLRQNAWTVECVMAADREQLAPLTRKKLEEFEAIPNPDHFQPGQTIVIDGLLGIGAKGPMRGNYGELAAAMNRARREDGALCFAIDIPSGVNGDTGEVYDGAVVADCTLTIAHVKAGLLEDQALDHVGQLELIPLPEIVASEGDDSRHTLHSPDLRYLFPPAPYSFHKGQAGRVGIVAGSRGLTGAAILSSRGALNAGGGLVTVFVREDIYPIIAAKAPEEVMVKPIRTLEEVQEFNLDAIGLGPGLGTEHEAEVLRLIQEDKRPMVIDADGLNMLSRHPDILARLSEAPGPRLLTPHPGELARLFPEAKGLESRLETAKAFCERFPVTLLYKGSRTLIAQPGKPVAYNTTGTPGMATGGIGDVLTGVCTAFAARGMSLYDAACLGSWLVGRSAEAYVRDHAPESLTAGLIADHLDAAFRLLRGRND